MPPEAKSNFKTVTATLSLAALIWSCGCSTTRHPPREDFYGMLRKELKAHGARTPEGIAEMPSFSCNWKSKRDENGIQILLEGNYFKEVDSFFNSMFGPPFSLTQDLNGKPFAYYRVHEIGVGLNYGVIKGGFVHIIILRPQAPILDE